MLDQRCALFSAPQLWGAAAICPRLQLIDVAIRMATDDPDERVGRVGKRIDVIQLTGFDQRDDDGPMLGTAIGAGEQRIFPVERNRTDRTTNVVVEFDTAIIDKARQTFPA